MSPKLPSLVSLKLNNLFTWSRNLPASSILSNNRCIHTNPKMTTAGIIVIGDELLKGDVQDTNSHHAMKMFHSFGIKVEKVSIIGDNIDIIANEVKQFSTHYDYVLTTGGIGPTHDDVTFDAVAKAFNVHLYPDPVLVKICSKFYKTEDLNAPGMKIAFIPETAKLTFGKSEATGKKTNYPNVSISNVYIFPGIPQLFKKSLDLLAKDLFQSKVKFYTHNIYLNVNEQLVVNALGKMVIKYPDVKFGSYPDMNNEKYKVKLTVESTDAGKSQEAASDLLKCFSKNQVVGA